MATQVLLLRRRVGHGTEVVLIKESGVDEKVTVTSDHSTGNLTSRQLEDLLNLTLEVELDKRASTETSQVNVTVSGEVKSIWNEVLSVLVGELLQSLQSRHDINKSGLVAEGGLRVVVEREHLLDKRVGPVELRTVLVEEKTIGDQSVVLHNFEFTSFVVDSEQETLVLDFVASTLVVGHLANPQVSPWVDVGVVGTQTELLLVGERVNQERLDFTSLEVTEANFALGGDDDGVHILGLDKGAKGLGLALNLQDLESLLCVLVI